MLLPQPGELDALQSFGEAEVLIFSWYYDLLKRILRYLLCLYHMTRQYYS